MRRYDDSARIEMKDPKGSNQAILYLGFDGVLHHESVFRSHKRGPFLSVPPDDMNDSHSLFQHADLLGDILSQYPDLRIVLATSWVRYYGCYRSAKRLPESLRTRVVGATFHSRMNASEFAAATREVQIWNDILTRVPKSWIAISHDLIVDSKMTVSNYIKTDGKRGISAKNTIAELKNKLEECF